MRFELSAGIIVYYKRGQTTRYLLLQSKKGYYDFPKGHVDPGETLVAAALRETEEESGLKVTVHEGFRERVTYFFRSPELSFKMVYFFVGRAKSTKVTISYEHVGHLWLPFDEALATLSFKNARAALVKADTHIHQAPSTN